MKISDEVLNVLGNYTFDGPRLMLPAQLDRKLYVAVNAVLEANGGKWNRSAKAHVFPGESAEDAIEQALATGEFRRVKQELGQFDTPEALADRVVELADIKPGMLIFEPSAGIGNLVEAIMLKTGTGAGIFANEIDPKRMEECRTRNWKAFGGGGLSNNDFLKMPVPPVEENLHFDRVVMNPPFAKQADIDHVLHAMRFVRAGGRLVAIMSASVRFRTNAKTVAFRELMDSMGAHWEDVPEGAFKESGTAVNAVIMAVDV